MAQLKDLLVMGPARFLQNAYIGSEDSYGSATQPIYWNDGVPTAITSYEGNAATATTWQNARTLTIGATGKSVNGSANVSWSLAEINGSTAVGGTTQPIYWTGSAFSATTYSLSATVNSATQYGVAYYSTTTNLTSTAAGAANTALMGKGSAAPAFVSVDTTLATSTAATSSASQKLKVTVLGVASSEVELSKATTSLYGTTKLTDAYTSTDATLATTGKSILAAIQTLDVSAVGNTNGSKYIAAISETDGKISATAVDVATSYSATGTTAISGTGVAAALETLDVSAVGVAAATGNRFISQISETDGKISATLATATIGSASVPIWIDGGTIKACTASSLFSDFSSSTNTLSITVAGQTRTASAVNSVSNTWTAGTTAGPTLTTTVNGVAGTAVAIPSASDSASGVVTTGGQTFKGIKTFYNEGATTDDVAAGIMFSNKDTTTGQTYSSACIYAYQDHAATSYGTNMVISPGGNLYIGSGEAPANLYSTIGVGATNENLYIAADSAAYLYANANTIANRIGFAITTGGHVIPAKTEETNTNAQNLGASGNRWAKLYIGTADTYGSASLPIYWNAGVPTACTASSLFSALSWTAGTSAGPTLSVTVAGQNRTATIPSASGTASGIITTGSQTFAGNKTFNNWIMIKNASGYYLRDTATDLNYFRVYIDTVGTTSDTGIAKLSIGNNTASGTAGNAYGMLYLGTDAATWTSMQGASGTYKSGTSFSFIQMNSQVRFAAAFSGTENSVYGSSLPTTALYEGRIFFKI